MVGDQRRTTLHMRQQFSVHSPQTVEKIQKTHYLVKMVKLAKTVYLGEMH